MLRRVFVCASGVRRCSVVSVFIIRVRDTGAGPGTLDPIRCTRCVKSSLEPGGNQRTKSNLSPERVYR